MAIPMPIVQDIRRLDRQGLSRAQIARRLHVDRGDRLDSPAAEVLTEPATHAAALVMPAAPPSALGASEHAPARAHPDLEHGFGTQRRIRDPHILCNHAFDVRQSGEQAFAQALFAIHFFGRKTEYAGTPLTLTEPTARRRTDIHENSNSAFLHSLQGRYLFSDVLPPMVICLTVMVVVTRFEFRMPLFIGLSLFTFDLYQWHIVLLRVLAP